MKPVPPVVIVADRGRLKVYHLERLEGRTPWLRLVTAENFDEPRQRHSEKVTDQAGAFPASGGGNSTAERMDAEAEEEVRAFRRIAGKITSVLKDFQNPRWAFAAPSEINGAIIDGLKPELHEALTLNLPLDLVNASSSEVLRHFEKNK